uniref:ferroxidase n=1 Tax=Amphilophus citrinellus TaxID=61819 RepID=A0A3Q0RRA5_AMPCI
QDKKALQNYVHSSVALATWTSASTDLASIAFYFDCDDVTLPGFSTSSRRTALKKETMLSFQIKRVGCIILQDIKKLERVKWSIWLEPKQCTLQLEKNVNKALLALQLLAAG